MSYRSSSSQGRTMFERLFGRKERAKLSASALPADPLRDAIIAETERDTPRFKDLVGRAPQVDEDTPPWTSFGEAVRDVARAAFSWDEPRVNKQADMLPSHAFNRDVVAQVIASREFQDARMYTAGNKNEAVFTSLALGDSLIEHAKECEEHIDRAHEAKGVEDNIERLENLLEQLRQEARNYQESDGSIPETTKRDIRQITSQREQAKAGLARIAQAHATSNSHKVAATVAKAAAEKMLDAAELGGFWQGLGPGTNAGMSTETQIELGRQLIDNKRLKEIARMAGRLIRSMRFKRQARTKNVQVEPVGITTGRDIGRMLPHELARAFIPALRPVWIKDYDQRSLLLYDMQGKQRAGKGPIVYVMDSSGSMKHDRIIWAQGVGLALLSIAQREKRPFAAVHFADGKQLESWVFPPRKSPDPAMVMKMISTFLGGGTDITLGLTRAMSIIIDTPKFDTADVVLATDGQCEFGEQDRLMVEQFREMGVRIHGVAIMAPNNTYLSQACDWSCDVADLAGDNEATERLAQNIT